MTNKFVVLCFMIGVSWAGSAYAEGRSYIADNRYVWTIKDEACVLPQSPEQLPLKEAIAEDLATHEVAVGCALESEYPDFGAVIEFQVYTKQGQLLNPKFKASLFKKDVAI